VKSASPAANRRGARNLLPRGATSLREVSGYVSQTHRRAWTAHRRPPAGRESARGRQRRSAAGTYAATPTSGIAANTRSRAGVLGSGRGAAGTSPFVRQQAHVGAWSSQQHAAWGAGSPWQDRAHSTPSSIAGWRIMHHTRTKRTSSCIYLPIDGRRGRRVSFGPPESRGFSPKDHPAPAWDYRHPGLRPQLDPKNNAGGPLEPPASKNQCR